MQSYSQNAQKNNIFQQLRDWNASRAANLTNREVSQITKLRSDKTHVDEALLIMKAVLVFATIFTSYCAFLFYESTFSKVFDPSPAWWAAVGLAIITELTKVFLLHRFLRSIFFGWISADWWSLGGWAFIGILSIGAYWWSINISTDGMNLLTKQSAELSTPKSDLSAEIKKSTADIDVQIHAAQSTQDQAINTKWKGTTTWRAQKIAGNSSAAIAELQAQRKAIVTQVTADYQGDNAKRTENISLWAMWIQRYGGYMEWVAAICICAGVFFERRLVAHNIARIGAPSPISNYNGHSTTPGSVPGGPNPPIFTNSVRRHRTLSEQKPPQAASTDSDFIRLRVKQLKGWDDNFRDTKNKPETVANNMHRILNEIGRQLDRREFAPDSETVSDLLIYAQETGFPALTQYGYQYPYEEGFVALCQKHITAMAAA